MQAILNIAIRAARKAGSSLIRERARLDNKFSENIVLKLQAQAEAAMVDVINKAYPDHGVVTSTLPDTEAETVWYIEMVSGFENLLRNIPHYAIVVVIEEQQKPRYSLIYDPNSEEIFTAVFGGGAQCNDYRLRTNQVASFNGALLATSTLQAGQLKTVDILAGLNSQGTAFYNQGCSALSLAYVAAGRVDGFFGTALSKTVLNAGILLLNEAGALMGDWQGTHDHLQKYELVAANPKLFKLLVPILKKASTV